MKSDIWVIHVKINYRMKRASKKEYKIEPSSFSSLAGHVCIFDFLNDASCYIKNLLNFLPTPLLTNHSPNMLNRVGNRQHSSLTPLPMEVLSCSLCP